VKCVEQRSVWTAIATVLAGLGGGAVVAGFSQAPVALFTSGSIFLLLSAILFSSLL
jgi:hypothetical protein